jgi:CubicO group peptidase (beta-lactamase class C family)
MHNPWLDNVIADALPIIQPAKKLEYNGMGYDLAGKVMEIVAGKSIFRLFQENFFVPLGALDTLNDDLACATQSSAENIARMAQLLLNKGSYGDTEFFSPATFEQMLPQKLQKYYPEVKDLDWGIGLVYFRNDFRTDSGQNGVPKDTVLLSPNTIGHGAASSSVLRADLDHDLVVTLARNRSTTECGYYTPRFLQAIDDGMIKDK